MKYQKQYRSAEEEVHRQQIFLENVQQMREYQQANPDASFSMGINGLMDRRVEVRSDALPSLTGKWENFVVGVDHGFRLVHEHAFVGQ